MLLSTCGVVTATLRSRALAFCSRQLSLFKDAHRSRVDNTCLV